MDYRRGVRRDGIPRRQGAGSLRPGSLDLANEGRRSVLSFVVYCVVMMTTAIACLSR